MRWGAVSAPIIQPSPAGIGQPPRRRRLGARHAGGRAHRARRGARPRLADGGGAVEDGEGLLDAVVREVDEETGCTVSPEALVVVYEVVSRVLL
jgi:ADP-ribose pyrophosphatase YjhB (NUDIX family)